MIIALHHFLFVLPYQMSDRRRDSFRLSKTSTSVSLIIGITLGTLSGCAETPPAVVVPVAQMEIPGQIVLEVLSTTQRISNAPSEEQRRELSQAQQVFQREKTLQHRLQLSVLLATPNLPGRDDARALNLLEPLLTHPHAAVRSLASLISEQILERQRFERKARTLQEQLEELKAMERSLIERSTPTLPKKP